MEDSSECETEQPPSTTTPYLSLDVLLLIVECSDQATLVNWTSTNRSIRPTAEKCLWRDLQLTYNDLKLYDHFNKFHRTPDLNPPTHGGILHALDLQAWRSGILVKHLLFKIEKEEWTLEPFGFSTINDLVGKISSHLPRLESCSFEGVIYDVTPLQLSNAPALRELKLRMPDDNYYDGNGESSSDLSREYFEGWRPGDFPSLQLLFKDLQDLPYLIKLSVGKLTEWESAKLAAVLPKLRLESLEITPGRLTIDPLIILFKVLARQCEEYTYNNGGTRMHRQSREKFFPLTMKSLILNDSSTKLLPTALLLQVISEWRNLVYLHVTQLRINHPRDISQHVDQLLSMPAFKVFQIGRVCNINLQPDDSLLNTVLVVLCQRHGDKR